VGRILDGLVHAQAGSTQREPQGCRCRGPRGRACGLGHGRGLEQGLERAWNRAWKTGLEQGLEQAGREEGTGVPGQQSRVEPGSQVESTDSSAVVSAADEQTGGRLGPHGHGRDVEQSQAAVQATLHSGQEAREGPPLAGNEQSEGQEGILFCRVLRGHAFGTRGASGPGSSLAVLSETAPLERRRRALLVFP